MMVLSLTQPWAQLIALGEKRIETRDWQTSHRGDLAIHAAKGLNGLGVDKPTELDLATVCGQPPFGDVLGRHGLTSGALPRGAVVAVVRLLRCTQMQASTIAIIERERPQEHAFGWYNPGRWAWVLGDIRPLARPYPLRGQTGIKPVSADDAEQIQRLAIEAVPA